MIIQGHAFGTAASLWRRYTLSEAGNPQISDPVLTDKYQFTRCYLPLG